MCCSWHTADLASPHRSFTEIVRGTSISGRHRFGDASSNPNQFDLSHAKIFEESPHFETWRTQEAPQGGLIIDRDAALVCECASIVARGEVPVEVLGWVRMAVSRHL